MQTENPQLRAYFARAAFLKSAPEARQLPLDSGVEIAFAGRSNAGKSSALNTLCAQKSLARASKRPGRTQLLNVFVLDEHKRLVDLPGYGYAEVPMEMRKNWGGMMDEYFSQRLSLKLTVLMMDIRHPMTDFDLLMLDWAVASGMPMHILLTKADKLTFGAAKNALLKVRQEIRKEWGDDVASIQLFSAPKRQGVDEALGVLAHWLQLDGAEEEVEAP